MLVADHDVLESQLEPIVGLCIKMSRCFRILMAALIFEVAGGVTGFVTMRELVT